MDMNDPLALELASIADAINYMETIEVRSTITVAMLAERLRAARPSIPFDLEPSNYISKIYFNKRDEDLLQRYNIVRYWQSLETRLARL